jgi:hypothetical protein
MPKKKSDFIPPYNSPRRSLLLKMLVNLDEYNEAVKKGLPFYSDEELKKIETAYSRGMAWKEIETELSSRGIIFKKPTFRKYLQENWLPPAIKDLNKKYHGKSLKYPASIIRHINFVKYLFFAEQKALTFLNSLLTNQKIEIFYSIQDELQASVDWNIDLAIIYYLGIGSTNIEDAIEKHFLKYPDNKLKEETLKKLHNLNDKFRKEIEPEIKNFISFLNAQTCQFSYEEKGEINPKLKAIVKGDI